VFPKITLVLTFLVMAVVLVIRPYGLLGRPPTHARAAGPVRAIMLEPAPRALVAAGVAALAAAIVLPLMGGDYARIMATEMVILVLFAASLHFMMGPGGLASFGHAAYFGVGAYAGALLLKQRRAGERTSEVLGLHIPDCRDECSYRVRGIACVPVVRHIP
jgi:branched-chain amino acid transport system permease protein